MVSIPNRLWDSHLESPNLCKSQEVKDEMPSLFVPGKVMIDNCKVCKPKQRWQYWYSDM